MDGSERERMKLKAADDFDERGALELWKRLCHEVSVAIGWRSVKIVSNDKWL